MIRAMSGVMSLIMNIITPIVSESDSGSVRHETHSLPARYYDLRVFTVAQQIQSVETLVKETFGVLVSPALNEGVFG